MALDELAPKIDALADAYRLEIELGILTRAALVPIITAARLAMQDGSEMTSVNDGDGGSQTAQVFYTKEVILAAAVRVYRETDPALLAAGGSAGDDSCVHMDFSRTRIEA